MVPAIGRGLVCWLVLALLALERLPKCNSFANGTVSFDSMALKTPVTITINFTVTWDMRANEIIHIYLPRFTRRLAEDSLLTPTYMPSRSPTTVPTKPPLYSYFPTVRPSPRPSPIPTITPSNPTAAPTVIPSPGPTPVPTPRPSVYTPTGQPTRQPTGQPTRRPSGQPTRQPSGQPSRQPTSKPSRQPSRQPSSRPTSQPSGRPTVYYYPRHRSNAPLAQPTSRAPTQFFMKKSFVHDVLIGNLILSPSSIFQGAWTEGDWKNYNASHKETNYPGGMLTLRRAAHFNYSDQWIPSNTSISLVIYASNGIGAYCGFSSSSATESTTRFSGSQTNHGNMNVDSDLRFLIVTNYSRFPSDDAMAVHTWPVNLYNGLKNRLLPNVSYLLPQWQGMGPGCAPVTGGSNDCNGHGICDYCSGRCSCFQGYGNVHDLLLPGLQASPDCSLRTCPLGAALADVALTATKAHRPVECSNAGLCNRQTGECECFPPWTGAACNRMRCPNDCSGHGQCLSIRQIARLASIKGSAFHKGAYYGHNVYYGKGLFAENPQFSTESLNATVDFRENILNEMTGVGGSVVPNITRYYTHADTVAWDHDTMFACVCESSWPVGLDAGETQLSEWFGPDCSLKHCPSGDDPFTSANELHCNGINQLSSSYPETGHVGNLCHIDCSNRGICDYNTGTCTCFKGSHGQDCSVTARTGIYNDAKHAPEANYLPPFSSDNTSATQQIELGVDDGAPDSTVTTGQNPYY